MKKEWLFFGGAILFIIHMAVIYDDVQAVVDDPNMENKPTERVGSNLGVESGGWLQHLSRCPFCGFCRWYLRWQSVVNGPC